MAAAVAQAIVPRKRGPPTVVGPTNKIAQRPTKPLPKDLIDAARSVQKLEFDAKTHINFVPPNKTYTMTEIGLEGEGISDVAISEPFSLFTQEAAQQIRREIFSEPVLEKCQYASSFAKNMIRGYSQEDAPFTHALWKCPEVVGAVSLIAGIEVVPAFEYEIGHINITINEESSETKDDGVGFSWHYDSFPFVCVTMLSDCTGMTGGETALRTGTGEIMKARGPDMGTAVILQGRYIEHAALKALGGRERISMITPFRPKSPFVRDELVLTGSRSISALSELYLDYAEYRATVLEERFREEAKKFREQRSLGQDFAVDAAREFITTQKEFLEAMLMELV
ncbi:hypothetical protein EDB81DRAFT_691542 [Dactylonectria macrodidyma]|uniref:Fe2OG dioxygenase domain-containing protein n=1 Tax=Dactylonectria macrodidyma TaxID=307937 RepID=A0A9P9J5N7_9HYPO|nr:hypothetical protein EDB81DRAFT_691542 [Dactylonectria macrodidyma]